MQHIETIELGSSQSSITFSSIPQDYDDLVILFQGRSTVGSGAEAYAILELNNAAVQGVILTGNGSSASGFSRNPIFYYVSYTSNTANTFGNTSFYISNYTSANAKSISIDNVKENNATSANQAIIAGLSATTSAITSASLIPTDGNISPAGNWEAGTTASLYGITAGGDGTVTTS